jgi:hypothetical protein
VNATTRACASTGLGLGAKVSKSYNYIIIVTRCAETHSFGYLYFSIVDVATATQH